MLAGDKKEHHFMSLLCISLWAVADLAQALEPSVAHLPLQDLGLAANRNPLRAKPVSVRNHSKVPK